MALTEVTIEISRSQLWNDPANGITWQIITGWESYTRHNGDVKNRKWTLWATRLMEVGEGDVLTAVGDLDSKVDKWTKDGEERNVVAHSLHEYTIKNHDITKRRGGDLNGVDQDDVRKYGHPTYGSVDGTANVEAPF
jgi:hypothetical protein